MTTKVITSLTRFARTVVCSRLIVNAIDRDEFSFEYLRRASNPERNFEWNQLLDSSIGLSPLYPTDAMDLHVTMATDFQPSFLGLRPRQA